MIHDQKTKATFVSPELVGNNGILSLCIKDRTEHVDTKDLVRNKEKWMPSSPLEAS